MKKKLFFRKKKRKKKNSREEKKKTSYEKVTYYLREVYNKYRYNNNHHYNKYRESNKKNFQNYLLNFVILKNLEEFEKCDVVQHKINFKEYRLIKQTMVLIVTRKWINC